MNHVFIELVTTLIWQTQQRGASTLINLYSLLILWVDNHFCNVNIINWPMHQDSPHLSFGGVAGMRLEWASVFSAMELGSGDQTTFRRSWRSSGNETKEFVHTSCVLD